MRIEAQGVRKRFGAVEALRGVDLDVASGRRVALIGPNGSGKSTLIRALLGLVACEGKVLLGGRSPWTDRLETVRRTAYVPQVAPHFTAPVGELLRAVASVRGLAEEDIGRVAARLEVGIDDVRSRPFRNLSGGTKQKLLIALALASRPELLIMDEPTASLDVAARDRFFEAFEDLAPQATLVLCSHRLDEIQHLVDDVVALREGRVEHAGSAPAWLATRAASIIEVRPRAAGHEKFLEDLGFARSRTGWWRRSAARAESVSLVSSLALHVGADAEDIVVRHVERVDAGGGRRE